MTTVHPLRVMIVDDEAHAREGLRLRLRREPDVLILGEFGDTASALAALRSDTPDVLFLDIEMPLADGFSLLDSVRDVVLPAVVFVTAHERHAVRAFDARALDYLLKPMEQTRLRESLDRAREHLERTRLGELAHRMRGLVREVDSATELPGSPPTRRALERLPVNRDGTIHFVMIKDIAYITASGDSVVVRAGRERHAVRKSMGEMLVTLDSASFARIHRSTIVNLEHVRELEPYFHGEYLVVLKDGTKLKLSRGYRPALSQLLGVRSL